jgi:hypothetical protein
MIWDGDEELGPHGGYFLMGKDYEQSLFDFTHYVLLFRDIFRQKGGL